MIPGASNRLGSGHQFFSYFEPVDFIGDRDQPRIEKIYLFETINYTETNRAGISFSNIDENFVW